MTSSQMGKLKASHIPTDSKDSKEAQLTDASQPPDIRVIAMDEHCGV